MKLLNFKKSSLGILKNNYNLLQKAILSNKRYNNYAKYSKFNVYNKLTFQRVTKSSSTRKRFRFKIFLMPISFVFMYFLLSSHFQFFRSLRIVLARPIVLYLGEILRSDDLIKAGADLISGLFRQQMFYDAVLELLISILRDSKFMEETKIFGINLFEKILKDEEFQKEIIILVEKILRMEEMKNEGIEILKYIIDKKESKDILSNYFKAIFHRDDIYQNLSNLFLIAIINAIDHPDTKSKFSVFLTNIWADKEFRWFIIKKTLNFWSSERKLE